MGQNKAIVAAVPKPGQHREDPRSYRLIALLCSPLKLYKRMILSIISARVESRLIPQICFRPGKSCINQVLNLTQYTGQRLKTDVAFTDISSAYNTVNVNRLLNKVYNTTTDQHLTKVTRTLLTNRRFFVEFQGNSSRCRILRNVLLKRSVLLPILFNIYTNNQPITVEIKSFACAHDMAAAG
ncbi:hypothetical protein Trydic_g20255 [Trypoxylus dichotomus]